MVSFRKYGVQNFILSKAGETQEEPGSAVPCLYRPLQLHQQGYALVFIGHWSLAVPAFDELLQQAPPEIRQSVHWLDKVPDEDLASFYRAAAVLYVLRRPRVLALALRPRRAARRYCVLRHGPG